MRASVFQIRLVVVGAPDSVMQECVPDLLDEMQQRPWFGSPRVGWEAHTRRVFVTFDYEAVSGERLAEHCREEVFEAASAVLDDDDWYRVEVVGMEERAGGSGG